MTSEMFSFNSKSNTINGKMSLKDFRRFIKTQSDLIDNGEKDVASDDTNETHDLEIKMKAADELLNKVNFSNDWDGNTCRDNAVRLYEDAKGKLEMKKYYKNEMKKWQMLGNDLPELMGLNENDKKCDGCNEKNCDCKESDNNKAGKVEKGDLNGNTSNIKNHSNVIENNKNELYCCHCNDFVEKDRYNAFADACFDCLETVFSDKGVTEDGDLPLDFDFDE